MKTSYILAGAVVVGAVVALFARGRSVPTSVAPSAEPAARLAPPAPQQSPASAQTVEGEVVEVLNVPDYTYLRLRSGGGDGVWTAVPSAKVEVGQRVKVKNASQMASFQSPTLGRTFDVIYFGVLEGGPSMAAHGRGDPHAGPAASGSIPTVKPGQVKKAAGPDGRTIAEIYAKKKELSGKKVRVRGIVVKATGPILGKTYVHLRDGTGEEGKNDLTVTTTAEPKVGDEVQLEGALALDRNIGAGYRFPVILEDAALVTK